MRYTQRKMTIPYPSTSIKDLRLALLKSKNFEKMFQLIKWCLCGSEEKGPSFTVGGNVDWCSKILGIALPCNLAIPLLEYTPENQKYQGKKIFELL